MSSFFNNPENRPLIIIIVIIIGFFLYAEVYVPYAKLKSGAEMSCRYIPRTDSYSASYKIKSCPKDLDKLECLRILNKSYSIDYKIKEECISDYIRRNK